MRTWIVSVILLCGTSGLGADFTAGGIQMDLNPPVRVAVAPKASFTAPLPEPASAETVECREFRFVSALCETINNFLKTVPSK
ncbi:MAG TPA: hypothetical protein VFV50_10975 [Bdellovibrionales bacterium]|nr:hypothetical protein [Bdellovibrionales bacterium]